MRDLRMKWSLSPRRLASSLLVKRRSSSLNRSIERGFVGFPVVGCCSVFPSISGVLIGGVTFCPLSSYRAAAVGNDFAASRVSGQNLYPFCSTVASRMRRCYRRTATVRCIPRMDRHRMRRNASGVRRSLTWQTIGLAGRSCAARFRACVGFGSPNVVPCRERRSAMRRPEKLGSDNACFDVQQLAV